MSQKPIDNGRSRSRSRSRTLARPLIAATALLLVFGFASAATAAPLVGTTARISVDSAGTQGNNGSQIPTISGDGRYITYYSEASNLVLNDTNGVLDVFLFDSTTSETTRISVDSIGNEGNGGSAQPVISDNGQFVTYVSSASNLVVGDVNGFADVFVFDTTTETTTRISVDSGGVEGNSDSRLPAISSDGRYISFESEASNLVALDTNGASDVFLFDTLTTITSRLSVDSVGTESNADSFEPAISGEGRFVTYSSVASNLVGGDINGTMDVFLHETTTGATSRVSVDSVGVEGNDVSDTATISADGRYIAYNSAANNLVVADTNLALDVFLFDRTTASTTRVSVSSGGVQGNGDSLSPAISNDGRYITYDGFADNLVSADANGTNDVFLFDRTTGTTTRISVDGLGVEGNSVSRSAAISGDGRYIAYESFASNLVLNDTNDVGDVFLFAIPAAAGAPALAATGSDPVAVVAFAMLLLGVGAFTVTHYRKSRIS